MDRMELLKLALGSAKDPRDALKLAQEMADFVAGSAPAKPAPAAAPKPEPARASWREAAAEFFPKNAAPAQPAPAPRPEAQNKLRAKKQWARDEIERAASLLDAGASYTDAARIIGRTRGGVLKKFVMGELPCKVRKKDPDRVLMGKLSVLARGEKMNGTPQA